MRIALAVALALLLAPVAWCQVFIGGAQSLYVQPNVRSAGMADCTIAVVDDASASSWNPGGLAFIQGNLSLAGAYNELAPDWDVMDYWYGAAAVRVASAATVAASVTYLSYPEQHVTAPDEPDPFVTLSPSELVVSGAFALAVGENIGVGLNLKHIKVDMGSSEVSIPGQMGEGSTFAADVGAEYRTSLDVGDYDLLVRGGCAAQNLGPDLEYEDSEHTNPLPRNLRLGASGQLSYGEAGHVLLCGQYGKYIVEGVDDSSWILGLGGELQISLIGLTCEREGRNSTTRDVLTGRIGWVDDEDGRVEGMSYGFGVGVDVDDTVLLNLDWAKVPQAEGLTEPWRFGGSGWIAF